MAVKLTDRTIRAMRPAAGARAELADLLVPGLRIRASATSAGVRRAWMLRYRDRATNALRKLSLGSYPDVPLEEARDRAREQRRLLADNVDPREERDREARAAAQVVTVEQLVGEYLAWTEGRLAPKTIRDLQRYLGELVTRWGTRPPGEIGRGDCVLVLDDVSARGNRAAGHLLASARACWSWAIERDRVEGNPWMGLKRQQKAFKSGVREGRLESTDLSRFVRELPHALPERGALACRVMLWTGCRPTEACGAEWSEFDLDGAAWTIPAERMKAGKEHAIRFPRQMTEALLEHRRAQGRGRHKYVFPSAGEKCPHLRAELVSEQLRRAFRTGRFTCAPVKPHDLRRSAATGLASLGIRDEVISRVLAHARHDVTGRHYQHHGYDDERRDALQQWADHLDALAVGNVVPISRWAAK